MKGVFIHQQLEYRIEMPKDAYQQGEQLPCTFSIKNHASTPQTISDVRVQLALKSVQPGKSKKGPALLTEYPVLAAAEVTLPWQLSPQQQQSVSWTFTLDRNCPISEKSQTLCLVHGSAPEPLRELPIVVSPHPHIATIIKIFETTFQFVLKSQKSSKGWVEAKFKPSSARRLFMVNELVLGLQFDGDTLVLRYVFSVKKLDSTSGKVGVRKGKTEVEQRLGPDAYLVLGGFINQEAIEASIEQALQPVSSDL